MIVAASVLAADFSRICEEIERGEHAGADWFHLDVMDGHFVDNISFGPAFCDAVRGCTGKPLDVHLMIERPDHYLDRFIGSANNITVHIEPPHDVRETLRRIREAGCTAGLALNPATPLSEVVPYLEELDLLLVMTVHPGFGGQKFRPEMMEKLEQAVRLRAERNLNFLLEVDGGINTETAGISRRHGADILVAGSSLYGESDMAAAIRALRRH